MGIEKGITLIAGGGYHGKSTLLKALERGVYNHISGDGRETGLHVLMRSRCRVILKNVEKSKYKCFFINNLPGNKDNIYFLRKCQRSTSQAQMVGSVRTELNLS